MGTTTMALPYGHEGGDAVPTVGAYEAATLSPSQRHVGGRQANVSGWSRRESNEPRGEAGEDAVTGPLSSSIHAAISPSGKHVGGRQPSVSGWSRKTVDAYDGSRESDAVTMIGEAKHAQLNGVDSGGRQPSISGWSRRHIPVPSSVFQSGSVHDEKKHYAEGGASTAANHETMSVEETRGRRHFEDEGRGLVDPPQGHEEYSERQVVGYQHERRHVTLREAH